MNIIVTLEASNGKTLTERITAKSLEIGKKLALRKNKNCSIIDSYEDRKQARKSMLKTRW